RANVSNPLIAPTQDSTKAYSGISLLESANDLSTAIESGDWASVAMGAVGTGLEASPRNWAASPRI
ncbi:hypothetical protein AB0F91_37905, partial [Amycolatopsis sp. NPDC023774]|uniref:hypothetical protein n=1 Tax=Amycolatopsis sp. NPDC023774 TaxID=3155015 RepID=UPI0033E189B3